MSHAAKQCEEFVTSLPKVVDFAEERRLREQTQGVIKENSHTLIPILAELTNVFELKAEKAAVDFFKPSNKDTKEAAQAKIATWKDAKRLIENLIHKDLKEAFNASRRSRG